MGKSRTDGAERKLGQDDLSEYLRAKEPGKAELAGIWRAAIGLQKVDGLTPSAYLVETARRNIEGEITIAEAGKIIGEYYKSKAVRAEAAKTRTDESDIVYDIWIFIIFKKRRNPVHTVHNISCIKQLTFIRELIRHEHTERTFVHSK